MISIFGDFKLIMYFYYVMHNIRSLSGRGVLLTDRLCTMYHYLVITRCVQVEGCWQGCPCEQGKL